MATGLQSPVTRVFVGFLFRSVQVSSSRGRRTIEGNETPNFYFFHGHFVSSYPSFAVATVLLAENYI